MRADREWARRLLASDARPQFPLARGVECPSLHRQPMGILSRLCVHVDDGLSVSGRGDSVAAGEDPWRRADEMPELPEVERARTEIDRVARGRWIAGAEAASDPIVFSDDDPDRLAMGLVGRRVEATHRRGKHLWLELDRPPHLLLHLGMTGAILAPDSRALELASGPTSDGAWPPRFTKLRVRLEGGNEWVMTNARRLGRIRLRRDPMGSPPLSRLGFDPLLDPPTLDQLVRALGRRGASVKAALLDQSLLAGVGNWIADEVLYQSRIDPRRRARDLSRAEVKRLRRCLLAVVSEAVAVGADKDRFPRRWIFHHRWGRVEGAKTARGEPIEFLRIAGRTTAWVPSVQR